MRSIDIGRALQR